MIGLTQKDPELNEPSAEDFLPVGVEMAVGRLLHMPDGSYSALVQGRKRVEIVEFVAQGANAGWRQVGVVGESGKKVARVWLEGQHAAGYAALLRLALEQREHGLVATVHAVKVANR